MKVKDSLKDSFDDSSANLFKLGAENIFLGRKAATKEEAIRFAGEQLVKGGYVEPEYVQAMLDREKLTPTYLGESIAVPHGTVEAKDRVLKRAWCSASTRKACASVKKKMTLPVW